MNKHRSQLVLTYILFSLEMLGGLLRPLFLGIAINDLMKGSYNGLILLSAAHLVTLSVGTMRHMYDTRTYSAIYVSLVTKFLSRRIYNKDVSKLSAYSTFARELECTLYLSQRVCRFFRVRSGICNRSRV